MSARRGQEHYLARLTEREVLTIVGLRQLGYRASLIARKYEVSRWTIIDILRGRSWKYLARPIFRRMRKDPKRKRAEPRLRLLKLEGEG